jgi:hypothetical protein
VHRGEAKPLEISHIRRFQERTKVLYTIVHSLEASNYLDIGLDVIGRLLLISTLESFTIGHTILRLSGMTPSYPLGTSSPTGPTRAYGSGPCRLSPFLRLTVEVDYCMSPLPGWGYRWAVAPFCCSLVRRYAFGKNFARPGVAVSRAELKLARAAVAQCVWGRENPPQDVRVHQN